jgi:acyl dehydratase
VTESLSALPSLPALYARAAVQAVRRSAHPAQLGSVTAREVPLDSDRLRRYRRVCGYVGSAAAVPATYLHVVAFPLQLLVMTAPAFPFRALGLVHVSNAIRQEAALAPADRVDLLVFGTGLGPHRHGRQVSLVTEASIDGELVWRETSVLLARESPGAAAREITPTGRPDESPPPGDVEPPAVTDGPVSGPGTLTPDVWRLPSDLGRRYAAASGDRNPIHLYDVTARPFGFRHHIAHGMWTKARALAELGARLPDKIEAEVAFKRPVPLPSTVRLSARDDDATVCFDVAAVPTGTPPRAQHDDPVTHLVGTVSRL